VEQCRNIGGFSIIPFGDSRCRVWRGDRRIRELVVHNNRCAKNTIHIFLGTITGGQSPEYSDLPSIVFAHLVPCSDPKHKGAKGNSSHVTARSQKHQGNVDQQRSVASRAHLRNGKRGYSCTICHGRTLDVGRSGAPFYFLLEPSPKQIIWTEIKSAKSPSDQHSK
jgi:hypothetical protein